MSATFQLPRGVTGFGSRPLVDLQQLRGFVYDCGQRRGYRVLEAPAEKPVYPYSYVRATIQIQKHTILLLINIYAPVLGFASEAAEHTLLHEFVDRTDLAGDFANYNPLNAAVLNAAPTEDALSLLSRAERQQLNYWKPERIGDILFNGWD